MLKVLYICVSTGPTSIAAEIANRINDSSTNVFTEIVTVGGDDSDEDYNTPSLFSPKGLASLTKVLLRSQPDIIHIHPNAKGALAILPARAVTDSVIISHEHTDREEQGRVRQAATIVRDVFSNVVVSNSKSTKATHESLVASLPENLTAKQELIYNGVDIDAILDQRPTNYGREGVPLLVVASRIAPEKDFETLLKGISAVWERGYELDIAILGDGDDVNLVKSWAEKYDEKHIRITGEVTRTTVWRAFQEADLTASASIREGFGVAVAEAMAAGAVPVVTNIPAHREVIGDVGDLFPIGEAQLFADKLGGLLDEEDLLSKESKAARERAKQFALTSTVIAHIELYQELC